MAVMASHNCSTETNKEKPGSSSTVLARPSSSGQKPEIEEAFSQFDAVTDHSDHFYAKYRSATGRSKEWAKKIQQEWKILAEDLPEAIFVRVYEQRMDLMRAAIRGSPGTPYKDGLFFFDIKFPNEYPAKPPFVYYHSHGLHLNPNLHENGTVCLSLLNTWKGKGSELWVPERSTILQLLVSIQGLVLNSKPYFNEPGYGSMAGTPEGERNSVAYNDHVFVLSCKTMLYVLRKTPKYFEDLVRIHFGRRGCSILEACTRRVDDGDTVVCCLGLNWKVAAELSVLFPMLVTEFEKIGVDCKKFVNVEERRSRTERGDSDKSGKGLRKLISWCGKI